LSIRACWVLYPVSKALQEQWKDIFPLEESANRHIKAFPAEFTIGKRIKWTCRAFERYLWSELSVG
jgi:hypothetical protein